MKAHPEARDLVARINQHNGQLLARADAAAGQVLRALFMVAVAALGGYFLAEYFTPCESAAHLCMAVVGLHSRRRPAEAIDLDSPLQTAVADAVAAARAAGELDGHKLGFFEGVRRGMWVGVCWGLTAGVLLIVGAFKAGLLVGYL
jgi:hypothetical protein